jgi:predicted small integral membrane protein
MQDGLLPLSWMAWTAETAIFFAAIAGLLVIMTVWELAVPGGGARRGILAIETTRGDRLFVSLLGAAYIHLAWLALLNAPLWGASVVAVLFAAAVFRWV